MDTHAAYRSLMYHLSNEQMESLETSETVDDLKIGLCAAAVLYTGAMEEVERATRGPEYAAANPSECDFEPELTRSAQQFAKLNQFAIEQELKTAKITPCGVEILDKVKRMHSLFMSNEYLPHETREFVATISLIAMQYVIYCFLSEL